MIQFERRQAILRFLEKKSPSSVREIATNVYASEASVRRDVAALEKEGLLTHVYGGVLLSSRTNAVVPLALREGENVGAKDLVARAAAQTVFDGATVFLDASSTVRRMMPHLQSFKNLKIITNSLRIFTESDRFEGTMYCTGGSYDPQSRAFYGPLAERFTENVTADLFFFSSQCISNDGEISDFSEQDTALRKKMLQRAKASYFLCDETKLGKRNMFTLCTKEEITGIFCDAPLPWEHE